MFTPQKIAVLSGIVGSLAAAVVGAGPAGAVGHLSGCDSLEPVCVRKSETRTDKEGEHALKQEQSCSTNGRPNVVFRKTELVGGEKTTSAGQVVDCSNTAELPEGFKKPRFE